MYPRDGIHFWPGPNYEITGKNPWSRAFQRWAPLYVLVAICSYISYCRHSDGAPWPFNGPYQLVGVFFLMIHGAFLGALLSLRRIPTRWEPEAVTDYAPEAIRARLEEIDEHSELQWRTRLLAALERCTDDRIRRSLECELTTRGTLTRQQNDALDLSTRLVIARAAEPANRMDAAALLIPVLFGLVGGVVLQFPWTPVRHWHLGVAASVIVAWCLGILAGRIFFRPGSQITERQRSCDLRVARALDDPGTLVEALWHMEVAAWEREDGPAYFSAQYWRERREKLEVALRE